MSRKPAPRVKNLRPDRFIFWALLALLIWIPMPWGSFANWASALMGFVVAGLALGWIALLLAAKVTPPVEGRADLRWPLLLWLLWLGWIAFSLMPLPQAILGFLSPAALQAHRTVAAIGGDPWWCLSLNPGRTLGGLIQSTSYFVLYWLVVFLLQARERVRLLLVALVVSGLFQASYGVLMQLSGLEYGFFSIKPYHLGNATGTLLTRNHFAGYLGLCIAAGVGLILADFEGRPGGRNWRQRIGDFINLMFSTKMQVRLALAIMVIGLVASRSRMGNAAALVALSVCGLGYVVLRERRLLPQAILLFASLLIVDTLIVSRWFGLEKVVQRIEDTRIETEVRTDLFTELLPVAERYAATGAGLGSFEAAYLPYRGVETRLRNLHAHNDYLEFLIMTGIPGAVLLFLLVGLHAIHALRVVFRRHDRIRVGSSFAVLMGILAAGLHATVEFNFQAPAYAATFVTLLAVAASNSQEPRKSRRSLSGEGRPTDDYLPPDAIP